MFESYIPGGIEAHRNEHKCFALHKVKTLQNLKERKTLEYSLFDDNTTEQKSQSYTKWYYTCGASNVGNNIFFRLNCDLINL